MPKRCVMPPGTSAHASRIAAWPCSLPDTICSACEQVQHLDAKRRRARETSKHTPKPARSSLKSAHAYIGLRCPRCIWHQVTNRSSIAAAASTLDNHINAPSAGTESLRENLAPALCADYVGSVSVPRKHLAGPPAYYGGGKIIWQVTKRIKASFLL